MPTERTLGALEQIPRGEGRNFALDGITIAVFRTHGDEVFATQPRCPHLAGPLADGLVGGTILMCPLHERAFDLQTGQGVGNELCLTTYSARVADGTVHVTM